MLVFDLRVQLQHCTYQRKTLLFALIKVNTFICKWEILDLSSPLSRKASSVTQYNHTTTVTTSYCAFLFIHPNIPFQHRHCYTFASTFHLHSNTWFLSADTFTPSRVLFYPFMLNLLFAYSINLINTNVGPITHPYYTKFDE